MDQIVPVNPDLTAAFLEELSSNAKARWGPSSSQWEQHRSTITRLYSANGKTLKEVQDYMCTYHGFIASEKIYKRHFKSWGLDKKFKKYEVISMLALQAYYKLQGVTPMFEIRGRPIDLENLARYVKRSHITVRDYHGISPLEAYKRAPDLVCHQSSLMGGRATTPDQFKRFEVVLYAVKSLMFGAFDSSLCYDRKGKLIWKQGSKWFEIRNRIILSMSLGNYHYQRNRTRQAGIAWRSAFLDLESFVHCPNPVSWLRIYAIQLDCSTQGHSRLATQIRYHLLQLIALHLDTSSPHRQFALGLFHLAPGEIDSLGFRICRIIVSCWESKLSSTTLWIEVLEWHSAFANLDQGARWLEGEINQVVSQAQNGVHNQSGRVNVRYMSAQIKMACLGGKYEMARSLLEEMVDMLMKWTPSRLRAQWLTWAYITLGDVNMSKNDLGQAKEYFLRTFEHVNNSQKSYGQNFMMSHREKALFYLDRISTRSAIADGD